MCIECSELFWPGLRNSYEKHVKLGVHLSCEKCDKKFGKYNDGLLKFHSKFSHRSDTDVASVTCDLVFAISYTVLAERYHEESHPKCKNPDVSKLQIEINKWTAYVRVHIVSVIMASKSPKRQPAANLLGGWGKPAI